VCDRICERVQAYRRSSEGTAPQAAKDQATTRLVRLIRDLRQRHKELQSLADAPSSDHEAARRKRECLKQRQACAFEINLVLAERGEMDLIAELEKLAAEKKIERLEAYLAAPGTTVAPAAGPPPAGVTRGPAAGRA
jgi:hypothetical protein